MSVRDTVFKILGLVCVVGYVACVAILILGFVLYGNGAVFGYLFMAGFLLVLFYALYSWGKK